MHWGVKSELIAGWTESLGTQLLVRSHWSVLTTSESQTFGNVS